MSIPGESQPREYNAPNAILDHMRRRIGRVGLLVIAVSIALVSLIIFLICACAGPRI